MATQLAGAVAVKHALHPDADRVQQVCRQPSDPARWDSQEFAAAQELVARWVAVWCRANRDATTRTARTHVEIYRHLVGVAKGWLVESVRKLAYAVADAPPQLVDEVVQELLLAVLDNMDKFDPARARFSYFAKTYMVYARSDAFTQVTGWNLSGVPDSWREVGQRVRKHLDEGASFKEAVGLVNHEYLGSPLDSDYQQRHQAQVKSGRVAALRHITDVMAVTQSPLALDAPVASGRDNTARVVTVADLTPDPHTATHIAGTTNHGWGSRFAALCGLVDAPVGDALATKWGVDGVPDEERGSAMSLKKVAEISGVARSQVVSAEREVKERVTDPLAWMVWLDDTYELGGSVLPSEGGNGVDVSVVW